MKTGNSLPRSPSAAIRAVTDADRERVERIIEERWGAPLVAVHDSIYRPAELQGFLAAAGENIHGLVTFRIEATECEIVSLDAMLPRVGIGTALVEAVAGAALAAGCRRLWLVTTNDNLDALRFYLRRGFRLVAVHPGAVDRARRLKPSIPEKGDFGIPIHDELELERALPSLKENT
ncbi:MAG: GNAT family N-acetyltransferase [Candidatus Aminicenantes bacterium]|nr:GNAT family N-acetyltransferase [Candidatus Aminicenantes bacterium]